MKLADYLATNQISNRAFAEKIGVSTEAVRLYLTGDRQPRINVMRAIVDATGGQVGPQDFFDAAPANDAPAGEAA